MRKILILFTAIFITNINAQDILPLQERAVFINKLQKEELENDPKQSAVKAVNNWKKILNQN